MIGVSRRMTAAAFAPRRARTSADSRSRSLLTGSLLGVMSSLPLPCRSTWRRMSNPRNAKPSSRWTIRVFSSLNRSPRGSSHFANASLTSSACSRLWR